MLLNEYVQGGGKVVSGARTGYKDETGRCRMVPFPGYAAELCGIHLEDFTRIVGTVKPALVRMVGEAVGLEKAVAEGRQADLLSVNRTSVYRPMSEKQTSAENIQIMHRIDEIYMKHPYYGYRWMTTTLREQGFDVNLKRVRRLMRLMGLEAIYPKPNLSKRLHARYCRPYLYLLRGLTIDRPNQVWGIDITYLRMGKGFMYLFNIIDWYSRKVIDYELSNTLEKGFVLKCLRRAFRSCRPEIMNSDQGSHFTNADYLELLEKENIKVSMDGKGRATDNSRTESDISDR